MTRQFVEEDDNRYVEVGDFFVTATFARAFDGVSPNGNPFNGVWLLTDKDGAYVDHDRWRLDLAARHGITLLPKYQIAITERLDHIERTEGRVRRGEISATAGEAIVEMIKMHLRYLNYDI